MEVEFERRLDSNGESYTQQEFQEYYKSLWRQKWDAATPIEESVVEKREDEDGKLYAQNEFKDYYGSSWKQKWDTAKAAQSSTAAAGTVIEESNAKELVADSEASEPGAERIARKPIGEAAVLKESVIAAAASGSSLTDRLTEEEKALLSAKLQDVMDVFQPMITRHVDTGSRGNESDTRSRDQILASSYQELMQWAWESLDKSFTSEEIFYTDKTAGRTSARTNSTRQQYILSPEDAVDFDKIASLTPPYAGPNSQATKDCIEFEPQQKLSFRVKFIADMGEKLSPGDNVGCQISTLDFDNQHVKVKKSELEKFTDKHGEQSSHSLIRPKAEQETAREDSDGQIDDSIEFERPQKLSFKVKFVADVGKKLVPGQEVDWHIKGVDFDNQQVTVKGSELDRFRDNNGDNAGKTDSKSSDIESFREKRVEEVEKEGQIARVPDVDGTALIETTATSDEYPGWRRSLEDSGVHAAMQAVRADVDETQETSKDKSSHRTTRQYLFSNEAEHFLWRENISGLGGIMIGVGAEQNYFMAGWARPEMLILADLNPHILNLHKAYGAAFVMAATPDEHIALWRTADGVERLSAGIRKMYGDCQESEDVLSVITGHLEIGEGLIGISLSKMQEKYFKFNIATVMSDQEQYDYMRNLWRRKRVMVLTGDLAGKKSMFDISKMAATVGLPVRILYLSNAMLQITVNMFDSPQELLEQFRENMLSLPFDNKTVVLHTEQSSDNVPGAWKVRGKNLVRQSIMSKIFGKDTQLPSVRQPGKSWIYQMSRGSEFQAWLLRGRPENMTTLVPAPA